MITSFDKNGAVRYYKKCFAERLDELDYEGALDYLIKYSNECENPHFHLACGMLYMLMTQDSDDVELCYLAYREFMYQIVRDPSCEAAYKNLVATEFLRRDMPDVAYYRRWLESCGIDYNNIMRKIADAGFMIRFGEDPIDYDGFFEPGEFGEIDPNFDAVRPSKKPLEEVDYDRLQALSDSELESFELRPSPAERDKLLVDRLNGEKMSEKSKVIKFGAAPSGSSAKNKKGKITPIDLGDEDIDESIAGMYGDYRYEEETYDDDEEDAELVERIFRSLEEYEKNYDDYSDERYLKDEPADQDKNEALTDIESTIKSYLAEKQVNSGSVLRLAESFYDAREFDAALKLLGGISSKDERYYYALCMRGLIFMECDRLSDAETAFAEASNIKPGGALVGTLKCSLYERQKRTDKIPQELKNIDNLDFYNGDHVYKAFRFALEYCSDDDALKLIEGYIDEYNILDIRLVYAQLLYNRGERSAARAELYRLSRIFYDDINIYYFNELAKTDADKLPVAEEAPQDALAVIVEGFMSCVEQGLSSEDADDDFLCLSLEFFLSLEFDNDRAVLKRMFDTVKSLADRPEFECRMRDALVSPYVEPIVKGVILSQLQARSNGCDFLLETGYKPISPKLIGAPPDDRPTGYYRAYAFVAALLGGDVERFIEFADGVTEKTGSGVSQDALAYYLVKRFFSERKIKIDSRLAYALGFKSRVEATAAYREVSKIAEGNKGE